MREREKPTIVRNPADDMQFKAAVDAAMAGTVSSSEALQEILQPAYPNVLVRPRQLAGERGLVWYVYRDGRWTSGH
ncbi:MAG TPA: hypothetical protein VM284_03815 [Candidatus Limnocylindria bacterium]|nr:hypothetical protein [Candidatus Limnocylindria bacterium]